MSKNTQVSEIINYLSYDGSGNIVFTTVFVDAMLGSGYINGTYWTIT